MSLLVWGVYDRESDEWLCFGCGEVVEDYEPEFCCSGVDCGCRGAPIEPPYCGRCTQSIYTPLRDKEQ